MRSALILCLAVAMSACGSEAPSAPAGDAPAKAEAKAAEAGDASIRRRRRPVIKLAARDPNRPKPGEPKRPEDFGNMAKTAEQGVPPQKPGAPPVERIDKYRFRVGTVEVDRQTRTVRVPARLNMKEGILEYFAVSTYGKLHESVLELFAEPSHIHLGLILVGLEPAKYVQDPQVGRKVVKPGSRVRMMVEWESPETKKLTRLSAEDWLYNRKTDSSPKSRSWAFSGSFFYNGQYAADTDRSVVALIPDGTAVIGNVADDGNPYRGDDLGYEVYRERVPPVGTPVAFLIVADSEKKSP